MQSAAEFKEVKKSLPETRTLTPLFNLQHTLQALQDKTLTTLDLSASKASDSKKEPTTLSGHGSAVTALAVLPDGRVISGSDDKTLKLWDLKSQSCVATLTGHSDSVYALVLVPDGCLMSGSGDKTIKLWNLAKTKLFQKNCVATLTGHSSAVSTLALLPDGGVISGSWDKTLKLWDLKSQSCVATLRGHSNAVRALAVLPDGRVISGSDDNTLKLWDMKNQSCVATLRGHSGAVMVLAVLPDGRVISGSDDNTLKLWDLKSQSCVATLTGHILGVYSLALLPDGCVISGSNDHTVKLWDLKSQSCVATLAGHSDMVRALTVLPDGRLMSGSRDRTLKLWEMGLRPLALPDMLSLFTALKTNRTVQSLKLSQIDLDDDAVPALLALLASNRTITQLDLRATRITSGGIETLEKALIDHPVRKGLQHESLLALPTVASKPKPEELPASSPAVAKGDTKRIETKGTVAPLLTAPDTRPATTLFNLQQMLQGLEDKTLITLDLSTSKAPDSKKEPTLTTTLSGHSSTVRALALLPDGRVISGSDDNTLKLWDLKSQSCVATLTGHSGSVNALTLLPDGRVVSSSGDNTLKLWDLKSQRCVATLTGHSYGGVNALALLSDGRVISGSDDNTLKLWDLKSQSCVATWTGHSHSVTALVVLPDGRVISGSTDKTLKLWDLKSQSCVATLTGHGGYVRALALLPDGRVMSGSGDNTLKLWDLKSQSCVATLTGHSSWVYALALLPDGRVMSGSYDKTLKLWDLKSQSCVATLTGHSGTVYALALLPDGRVMSGSYDNTLKLWDLGLRPLALPDMVALFTALKTSRTVQSLNLSQTDLDDNAVPTLLALFAENHTITQLDLRATRITSRGIETLSKALLDHPVRKGLQHESLLALPSVASEQKRIESPAVALAVDEGDAKRTKTHFSESSAMLGTFTEFKEVKKSLPDIDTLTPLFNLQQTLQGLEDKTLTTLDLSASKAPDSKKEPTLATTLSVHSSAVYALAVLPDGRVMSGSWDNTLKLWDLKSQSCVATLRGHSGSVPVYALALLPDGRVVSGSGDNTLKLWDLKSQSCVATLTGHSNWVHTLVVLPDGRVMSCSGDSTLKLWDLKSQSCAATLTGHSSSVTALALLRDGRVMSGSSDNTLKLWDLKSQSCVATLVGHSGYVCALAVLSDGRVMSGSHDKTLKLWDLKSQSCVATLVGHSGYVCALAVLPDGRVMSGSRDNTLMLWDLGLRPLALPDMVPLFTALQTNRTVQSLNLSQTDLDDDTIPALLAIFASNHTITQLDLRATRITSSGIETLHKALIDHPVQKGLLHESLLALPPVASQQKQAELPVFSPVVDKGNVKLETVRAATEVKLETKVPAIPATVAEKAELQRTEGTTFLATLDIDAKAISSLQALQSEPTQLLAQLQITSQQLNQHQQQITRYQTQIATLNAQFVSADSAALAQLQGRADQLQRLLAKEQIDHHIELERQQILADNVLCDYYYVFISQFTDAWLACKTIHSGKVKNDETTSLDYLPAALDKLASYVALPGVALLKDIANSGVKFWSARNKKLAVSHLATFFGGLVTTDQIIEALARQLTLSQTAVIQKLAVKQTGVVCRIIQAAKDIKNKISVNDIDTAVKALADTHCKAILAAIMQEQLAPHPTLADLTPMLEVVLGKGYVVGAVTRQTMTTTVSVVALAGSQAIPASVGAGVVTVATSQQEFGFFKAQQESKNHLVESRLTETEARAKAAEEAAQTGSTAASRQEFGFFKEQQESKNQTLEARLAQAEARAKAAEQAAQEAHQKAKKLEEQLSSPISGGSQALASVSPVAARQGATVSDEHQLPTRVLHLESTVTVERESHQGTVDKVAALEAKIERMQREQQKQSDKCLVM